MKTPARRLAFFAAVFVFSCAPLWSLAAPTPARGDGAQLETVMTSSEFVVAGEVIARNEMGFTVLVRNSELTTVRVNRYTAIKKGAETIRLSDIMVGDKVSVRFMRSADGGMQAVNVAVRTGFEPRA